MSSVWQMSFLSQSGVGASLDLNKREADSESLHKYRTRFGTERHGPSWTVAPDTSQEVDERRGLTTWALNSLMLLE